MRFARAFRLLLVVALIGGWGPVAAAKPQDHAPSRLVMLHLRWRLVARGGTVVAASGRYVLFVADSRDALIDQQTGKRMSISAPGCANAIFGGPWLMLECSSNGAAQDVKLLQLDTRQWRTVGIAASCVSGTTTSCEPVAVGADWIRLETTCYHCYEPSFSYQNISTGRVAKDPTVAGGRTIADLNSPALAHELCRPLRVPRFWNPDLGAWEAGSLNFYAGFAVAQGSPPGALPHASLERCGTRLDVPLPGFFAGSDRMIVWQVLPRKIGGRFLPGLQRFRISLPASISASHGRIVALSTRTLYVQAPTAGSPAYDDGPLWAATLPQKAR